MILFRASTLRIGGELTILIYAENEHDAIRYLKTLPLFWNLKFEPGDFKEVAPPKGPAPSVLLYSDTSNMVNTD